MILFLRKHLRNKLHPHAWGEKGKIGPKAASPIASSTPFVFPASTATRRIPAEQEKARPAQDFPKNFHDPGENDENPADQKQAIHGKPP